MSEDILWRIRALIQYVLAPWLYDDMSGLSQSDAESINNAPERHSMSTDRLGILATRYSDTPSEWARSAFEGRPQIA